MRKHFFTSLIFLLMFSLISCNYVAEIQDTYTSYEGVEIEISNIDISKDNEYITISWINKTPYNVIITEWYTIEKYNGTDWLSCANTDFAIKDIALYVNNNGLDKLYTLTYFDVRDPEVYRFRSTFNVEDNSHTSGVLWAEFNVVKES